MEGSTINRVTPLRERLPTPETERESFDLGDCLLGVIELAQDRPQAAPVILAVGSQLALGMDAMERRGGDFESWLIERWLAEVRSEEFCASAQYEYLRAEYEREVMGRVSRAGDARTGQLRPVGQRPQRPSGDRAR